MDALDDVGTLAERPQCWLGVFGQVPLRGTERLGEAEAFEFSHAPDQCRPSVSLRRAIGSGAQVDHPIMLGSLAGEGAIELGPTVGLNLGVETATNLKIASRQEFQSGKMCSSGAHALADVVAGNHEVAAVTAFAAHDDMDVGIVCVPVVDPNPIELRAEIPLGLRHQVPGERPKVGELLRVLRGHDEAEMVAIALAAIGERAMISVVMFSIEHPAGSALLRYAFPP